MKLKEFLENLNKLVKENPKALEYVVISSTDDEGNGFSEVYYKPSVGFFDVEEQEFVGEEGFEEYEIEETINAICIN